MLVYRFRVIFEDYDDVIRDIEVKATQTFEHLHAAINESIGFDSKSEASFFLSDEHWKKGQEFSTQTEGKNNGSPVKPMKNSRLTDCINDPHQKLCYVIDSEPRWEFYVELFKIQKEDPSVKYPLCTKSVGIAPKQYVVTALGQEKKDFDFLNEARYMEEEEFSSETDMVPEGVIGMEGDPSPDEIENTGDLTIEEDSLGESETE